MNRERERERDRDRDREREGGGGVSTETQREVVGFYTPKKEGTHRETRYLTDRAGGVAGLRHLEKTGMSHQNPEAQ